MRLAHFIQRYPPALGGSEAYFARLSRYCAGHGDAVTVFTSNALSLDAFWSPSGSCMPAGVETDAGIAIRRYPLWRMPGRRWLLKALSLYPHRLWQCLTMPCNPISLAMWRDAGADFLPSPTGRAVVGEGGFDAVHVSAFPYAFPIACGWRLARRLNIPFYVTPFLHLGNPDDPHDRTRRSYTSPALLWLLKEADAIFVQTPSERAMALALGLSPDKVILQGLGVEPRECTGGNRAEARRRWNLPDDAFVVGHLANNSWEKGTNDLIQAIEPLWRQNRPIYLLLAGPEMPNFTRFWQAFEQRFPPTFVRRLGPISDAEKRDFYAAIDAFSLPSRSDSFGLVLLEAWANGVPNIAYRAGGVADVIRHDIDGLLVPCGDIAALSAALQHLQEDVDLRVRLGMDGKHRLPRNFRWEDKLALVRQTIAATADQQAVLSSPGVINSL
ncbi:MAG: glycosyltransferase family 1 protein [Gemmataceae bacterium]|nr:glycosyltransferase family 1 protein [Gemmataceae bacterium]